MHLTAEQINRLDLLLATQEEKLKGVLASLVAADPAMTGDRSNDADLGTEAIESLELDTYESLERETRILLERTVDARARIQAGTYGVTASGEAIPFERLLIDPTVTTIVL